MRSTHLHPEYAEGRVAREIEEKTARLPSDTFLWLGLSAIAGSLIMKLMGKSHMSLFIGEWAPVILLLGVYNKLVKIAGSDQVETPLRR